MQAVTRALVLLVLLTVVAVGAAAANTYLLAATRVPLFVLWGVGFGGLGSAFATVQAWLAFRSERPDEQPKPRRSVLLLSGALATQVAMYPLAEYIYEVSRAP